MAATVSKRLTDKSIKRKLVMLQVASGWSDADTVLTGLRKVEHIVGVVVADTGVAAADAASVTIVNTNQLRLDLIGTARALHITVAGY